MTWRRLRPGELDHELIWLTVSLAAAVLGWAWLSLGLPLPGCVFHAVTLLPCPTCGLTRCARHLLAGSISEAMRINPLAVFMAAGVVLFDLYAVAVLATRGLRLRFERIAPGAGMMARIAFVALVAANWTWLIFLERKALPL